LTIECWYWARSFSKRPDANTQIEWQFSKEEIHAQTDLGKGTFLWKGFVKVVETSDGFLFYPLKNIFHCFHFQPFESPDCIEKVKDFVRQNHIPLLERGPTRRCR